MGKHMDREQLIKDFEKQLKLGETWRLVDFIGDFNDYIVTSYGRLYSLKSRKFLCCSKARGYKLCNLYKNRKRKTIYLHRLVALAFIPNDNNKLIVHHVDGNKLNNCITNLKWVSYSENIKQAYEDGLNHAGKLLKLNNENVALIRYLHKKQIGYKKIAKLLNISQQTIADIIKKRRKQKAKGKLAYLKFNLTRHTIIIDGVEIKVSDEDYKALKEKLCKGE